MFYIPVVPRVGLPAGVLSHYLYKPRKKPGRSLSCLTVPRVGLEPTQPSLAKGF